VLGDPILSLEATVPLDIELRALPAVDVTESRRNLRDLQLDGFVGPVHALARPALVSTHQALELVEYSHESLLAARNGESPYVDASRSK